jgi:hypothetical protein
VREGEPTWLSPVVIARIRTITRTHISIGAMTACEKWGR